MRLLEQFMEMESNHQDISLRGMLLSLCRRLSEIIRGFSSKHSLDSEGQIFKWGWTLFHSGVARGERQQAGVGLLTAPQLNCHMQSHVCGSSHSASLSQSLHFYLHTKMHTGHLLSKQKLQKYLNLLQMLMHYLYFIFPGIMSIELSYSLCFLLILQVISVPVAITD